MEELLAQLTERWPDADWNVILCAGLPGSIDPAEEVLHFRVEWSRGPHFDEVRRVLDDRIVVRFRQSPSVEGPPTN